MIAPNPVLSERPGTLRRPTVETKFHIDMAWWTQQGRDFHVYLRSVLCSNCRENLDEEASRRELDWVDPETAEVRRLNVLWGRIITCCSQNPDYITPATPLKEAVFRALLASANTPMSPIELRDRIGKGTPEQILQILVYGSPNYGIKLAEPL